MSIPGWKYYNNAAIPTTAPHEEANVTPVEDGSIWNIKGALLARWTTDWDCKKKGGDQLVVCNKRYSV